MLFYSDPEIEGQSHSRCQHIGISGFCINTGIAARE